MRSFTGRRFAAFFLCKRKAHQQNAVDLIQKAGDFPVLQPLERTKPPVQDLLRRRIVFCLDINVEIPHHDPDDARADRQQRVRQIRQRFARPVAVTGQRLADLVAVKPARVVFLPDPDGLICLAERKQRLRSLRIEDRLADFGIRILRPAFMTTWVRLRWPVSGKP